MNNFDKYKTIFIELFNVDESELNDGFTFEKIEKWDSLTHLTLIDELEVGFDVMFETEDILNFGGFSNGIEILRKYGVDI